jgi:hypothetical protein
VERLWNVCSSTLLTLLVIINLVSIKDLKCQIILYQVRNPESTKYTVYTSKVWCQHVHLVGALAKMSGDGILEMAFLSRFLDIKDSSQNRGLSDLLPSFSRSNKCYSLNRRVFLFCGFFVRIFENQTRVWFSLNSTSRRPGNSMEQKTRLKPFVKFMSKNSISGTVRPPPPVQYDPCCNVPKIWEKGRKDLLILGRPGSEDLGDELVGDILTKHPLCVLPVPLTIH